MCWHICNNCNDIVFKKSGENEKDPRPCIWFIPGVDESGLMGCPYHDGSDDLDPARWIAVPFSKIQELMEKHEYCYHDDTPLDKEYQEYNKDEIKRLIG